MLGKTARVSAAFSVAALAAAACLGSSPPGFRSPSAGSLLEPGATVRITWQLPAEIEGDEMELLLSLDGGETFPIRLTRDLAPTTSSVAWRVPSLASPHARLALRKGESGRDDAESVLFSSDTFAIRADPRAAPESLFSANGEWRTAEARDGRSELPESRAFDPAPPSRKIERDDDTPPFSAPRAPFLAAPQPQPPSQASAGTERTERGVPPRSSDSRSETPLRV